MSCGFAGNTDVYGLGIRIGYYAQAFAVWFSNYFYYREAKELRAVNNLLLLALVTAALIYFANAASTHVVEAFLMLQIGLVIGLVGITERSRFSNHYVKTSKERLIVRIITVMAGGLLNVCFWWKGTKTMLPTPCTNNAHGTYFFYFFKANMYGWAGILMKVQSLIAILWATPKIITFDIVVLYYGFRMRESRAAFVKAVKSFQIPAQKGNCLHSLWERSYTPSNSTLLSSPPDEFRPSRSSLMLEGPKQSFISQSVCNTISKDATTSTEATLSHDDVFKDINHAMKYMEDIFMIYPANPAVLRNKHSVKLCGGRHLFDISWPETRCTDRSASYLHCTWTTLRALYTNVPSYHLRWQLAIYVTASGQHPIWRWPRIVHRMYILSQSAKPPKWQHVAIASDILLSQIPLVITKKIWMAMAAWQMALIIFLVLQVELTITWNGINGLYSLSSLGQLIPFIIGLGGLVKVLWGKWRLVRKEIKDVDVDVKGEYELAMEQYLEWKQDRPGKGIPRAATV